MLVNRSSRKDAKSQRAQRNRTIYRRAERASPAVLIAWSLVTPRYFKEQAPAPPKWYQKKWVWGTVAAVGLVVVGGAVVGGVLGSRNSDPLERADFAFDLAGK